MKFQASWIELTTLFVLAVGIIYISEMYIRYGTNTEVAETYFDNLETNGLILFFGILFLTAMYKLINWML